VRDWVRVTRARVEVLTREAFCMDCVSVSCFSRSRAVASGFCEAGLEGEEGVASAELRGIALAASMARRTLGKPAQCVYM